MDDLWKRQAEQLIEQLDGVVRARIRLDGERLGAVYVESDGDRQARRIVRDVETILATRLGFEIDHRKVSVTSIAPVPASSRSSPRMRLVALRLETRGAEAEARVTLGLNDTTVIGIATAAATPRARRLLIARATLEAVALLYDDAPAWTVDDVALAGLAGRTVVIVLLAQIGETPVVPEPLVGAASVAGDETQAVVHAALDALNRVVAELEPAVPAEFVIDPEADAEPGDGGGDPS